MHWAGKWHRGPLVGRHAAPSGSAATHVLSMHEPFSHSPKGGAFGSAPHVSPTFAKTGGRHVPSRADGAEGVHMSWWKTSQGVSFSPMVQVASAGSPDVHVP